MLRRKSKIESQSEIELKKVPLFQGEASLPTISTTTPESAIQASILENRGKPHENPEDDDEYLAPIPEWTCREIVVAIFAAFGTAMSVILLLIPFNLIGTIMSIFGIIISPLVLYQEQKVTDCRAMEETNNAMGRELQNMQYENERLTHENDVLEKTIDKIQHTKDTIAKVQAMNGVSISTLESQLKESQEILEKMKVSNRMEVVDNIFDVMLALDKDQDMSLSDDEIDIITKKVESMQGVEINDELFKQKIIETGRNLDAVLKLLNGLLDDDPTTAPEEQKIITFLSASKMEFPSESKWKVITS